MSRPPSAAASFDLVVSGGTLVLPAGRCEADLGIAGGRIRAIAEPGTLRGEEEVDARGLWVLPGVVDAHFHCRAPAHPHREDWESATRAAVAVGVTTLLEMPISSPAAHTGAVVRARREVGETQAAVDFGLFAAPGTLNPADIASATVEGSIAFKVFLHAAPRRGVRATMETCPHYLEFTAAAMGSHGPFAKVNPPLRAGDDRATLWRAVRCGTMTLVASDHSPFAVAEKEVGWTDIRPAPSGAPWVEVLLPYLMDLALRGTLAPETAVGLLFDRPARLYRLAPRKGVVAPGADADLVLFDPAGSRCVDRSQLHTKARESAALWDGYKFRGRIRATYVRGRCAYRDGEVTGEPGWGEFVRPCGRGDLTTRRH